MTPRNPLSDRVRPLSDGVTPYTFIEMTDEQLISDLEFCSGRIYAIERELRARITRRADPRQ